VTLDTERPDATLMTWALDAYQVHVRLRGARPFSVSGGIGTVKLAG
jgi:hypothetical protein